MLGSELRFIVERFISCVSKWLRICAESSLSLLFCGGFKEVAVNFILVGGLGGGHHLACFAFNGQSERIMRSCCRIHSEVNDDIWCVCVCVCV